MFRHVTKKIFTTAVAGAIAVAGMTATPARADADDVAKVIVGFAALAMIANALDDDRDHAHRTHRQPDRTYRHHDRDQRYKPVHDGHYKRHQARKNLPAKCVRRHETSRGRVVFLGRMCLKNQYRHFGSLPKACKVQTNTYKGMRYGYQISCLRHKGYRLVHS